MIYVYDRTNKIYISLEGNITEELNKRGYNEITSTRGIQFQEHTRGVIDINIEISYLSESDYKKLKLMFLTSKSQFFIEDDDLGVVYNNYLFKGNNLSLSREKDVENKTYYYKGNLYLVKR